MLAWIRSARTCRLGLGLGLGLGLADILRMLAWIRSARTCRLRKRARWGAKSSHSLATASSSSMSVSFISSSCRPVLPSVLPSWLLPSWFSSPNWPPNSPNSPMGSIPCPPPSSTAVGPVESPLEIFIAMTCSVGSTSSRASTDAWSKAMPGATDDEQQSITKSISRSTHGMPWLASRIRAGRSRRATTPSTARRSKATEAKRYIEYADTSGISMLWPTAPFGSPLRWMENVRTSVACMMSKSSTDGSGGPASG